MSTLIIGGLFAVALIALVALVFVLRGETRTTMKATRAPKADPATSSPSTSPVAETTPTRSVPSTPTPESITQTVIPLEPQQETHFAMADGQFHELSVELHTLHEQAQEIEHRLSVLSEMIERIEGTQPTHSDFVNEYSPVVDSRPSAN